MTADELIAEGRRIERPCVFLRTHGDSAVAAIWHADDGESADERCWLTVDCRYIPTVSSTHSGYLRVYTDENLGGRVEVVPKWPDQKASDTLLYATSVSVLPPLEAVFAQGSDRVEDWLVANGWGRHDRPNASLPDSGVIERYEAIFMSEFPLYLSKSDIHAVLGGWHMPFPDDDWHDLIDQQLAVFTLRDCEPWVEAWQNAKGEFSVIQRTT